MLHDFNASLESVKFVARDHLFVTTHVARLDSGTIQKYLTFIG